MKNQPDDGVDIQRRQIGGLSEYAGEGAKNNVRLAAEWIETERLAMGDSMLVLGPAWGHELQALRSCGARDILAVEPVPEFCQRCRSLGFTCWQESAEDVPAAGRRRNIYASHSLEHCYDQPHVIRTIKAICLVWCFVVVPIECKKPDNPAHLSWISDADKFIESFLPLVPLQQRWVQSKVPDRKGNGILTILFARGGAAT